MIVHFKDETLPCILHGIRYDQGRVACGIELEGMGLILEFDDQEINRILRVLENRGDAS
jgi:hypothetical protein